MSDYLIKNLTTIYTFDHDDQILSGDLRIQGGRMTEIGATLAPSPYETLIDATGLIALPGFVNTHHHLYQTLFRGIEEVQELPLFPWLKGLYQFWQYITPEAVYLGAMVGLSELLRTGCTLTSDHHYVFPQGQPAQLIDQEIRAAKEIGIRFHATRGSMSLGVDQGGLPPMRVVQNNEQILEDSLRLIKSYHDPEDLSMTRIALAPCSPFSVTSDLMRETATLARAHQVMLHTHLAETKDEEAFCIKKYGLRPYELMDDLGWLGEDVWFAHGIYFNDHELKHLKGSGIAHCPSSNMKLNSGICRTSELAKEGVHLSIAVDGSASNDGSNMWEEVRRAYLINHLKYGSDGLSAYEILSMATRGGAKVLGRHDTGYLAPQMAADLNLFDLNGIEYAGCHDPLVALVSLGNHSFPKMTFVAGELVAKEGQILTIDQEAMNRRARILSTDMVKSKRLGG